MQGNRTRCFFAGEGVAGLGRRPVDDNQKLGPDEERTRAEWTEVVQSACLSTEIEHPCEVCKT